MRLPLLAILIALLGWHEGRAQDFSKSSGKFKNKFQFATEPDETIERTWFHYVVSRTVNGQWVVRTFYPETGQMTALMSFSDKRLTTLDGPFAQWYDDGRSRSQGAYAGGARVGPWVHGGFDGSRREGRYTGNKEQGIWTNWDKRGHESTSLAYLNGVLHGIGYAYDSTGAVLDTLVYEHGSLLNSGSPADVDERMPCLVLCDSIAHDGQRNACTEGLIMKHLQQNIHYPAEAIDMNVAGQALFEFTIDKGGKLVDVRALNALCRSIETECRRVFATLPPWKPGEQDGRVVNVQFSQSVKFELQ
ncbi:MAG: energy transducer TonB [Flavobacteriales bacterium]